MNIEVVGRIRPSVGEDGTSGVAENRTVLEVEGHNRLKSKLTKAMFTFQHLHKPQESTYDVFRTSVEPMMHLFMTGFNCCLIVIGDHGSGKSFTIYDPSPGQSGVLPLLIQHLFAKLDEDGDELLVNNSARGRLLNLQMFDVVDDSIKDLLVAPSTTSRQLEVTNSAEVGPCVANLTSVSPSNNSEGQLAFRQGWANRSRKAVTFIQLDLSMPMQDTSPPTKSRFSVAVLPALHPPSSSTATTAPTGGVRVSQPSANERSTIALTQLVAALANQPFPDRAVNYSVCGLTRLLEEGLGGNCKTTALVCFPTFSNPSVDAALFQLADSLSKVKNYPIINNTFAQQLLTQFRARIIALERQMDPTIPGIHQSINNNGDDIAGESLEELRTENVVLRDSNERLQQKLEHLKTSFGTLAVSKTDLSAQLLLTEEEKLKISQTLLDMQIENNRLREEMEAAKFELSNRIIQLEHSCGELGREKEKALHVARESQERLEEVEKGHKDLADVYIRLKSEHMTLTKAHQDEMSRNDELSMELLNIVNSKIALMEEMDVSGGGGGQSYPPASDRLRAIAGSLSKKPEKAKNEKYADQETDQKKPLLREARNQPITEAEQIRRQYEDAEKELRRKIKENGKELNESRKLTRETQRKFSEANAQLMTLKSERTHLKSQVNRLQHKLKDVNQEFQLRLVTYLKNVAESVKRGDGESESVDLKREVDAMLGDLKMAHKTREEQLSSAAQDFKRQLEQTQRRHEELLIAYKELRQQVESRGLTDVDLGPDETTLTMSDNELKSRQQEEIERLQEKLAQFEKVRMHSEEQKKDPSDNRYVGGTAGSWSDLQKQLRQFTLSTQQELEQERAELMSKNAMLEQEVEELHDYIDTHLSRYRDEIVRLRQAGGGGGGAGGRNPTEAKRQATPGKPDTKSKRTNRRP